MMQSLFLIFMMFVSFSMGQICAGLTGTGCYFNGIYYQSGETIKGACFILTCFLSANGDFTWIYTEDDINCDFCRARNDPHFRTFDGLDYDWHGLCNYTLAQYFQCPTNCSYFPKYGVYSDFYSCNGAVASCVGDSTYKVNENTVITIEYVSLQTFVNGYEITSILTGTPTLVCNVPQPTDVHPVIAWIDGLNCVNLQGIDFSIRACTNSIHLYTTKDHVGVLDGLCGFYTEDVQDEFLTRDCISLPLDIDSIPPFAKSWITLQQKDDGECCPNDEHKIPYEINCVQEIGFRDLCEKAIADYRIESEKERASLIENCVSDCCRAKNIEGCERIWVPNTKKLAEGVAKFGE